MSSFREEKEDRAIPEYQSPEWFKIFLFASIVLGILLLVLSALASPDGVVHHLSRDLGIALLVGVFVSITIERVSRERQEEAVRSFLRGVGENFIYAVYGNDFPRDLFDCVRETVFGTKLLRSGYKVQAWLYDLDNHFYRVTATPKMKSVLSSVLEASEDNSGLVLFHCRSEFTVKNVSAHQASYPLSLSVDGPFEKKKRGLAAIVSVILNGEQQIPDVPIYQRERANADASEVSFERNLEIQPGDKLDVEVETYLIRRLYDEERWVSLMPADGMTVEVYDQNGNKDIKIDLSAPLFGSNRVASARKNEETNRARLEVRQYLLPYQGTRIKWGSKPTPKPVA
jgi:hypothetical protein